MAVEMIPLQPPWKNASGPKDRTRDRPWSNFILRGVGCGYSFFFNFDRNSCEHTLQTLIRHCLNMDRVKRIWYLSPMRAAKVQASLRIRAVSPEPSLLAHTSSASRGTFRQKARSLAPLNGWACTVEICHDGMLEDTNLLDGAHMRQEGKLDLLIISWE